MCGFVGIIGPTDVAPGLHIALQALQHRGQDSAGIATMAADGARFFMRRGLGKVTRALDAEDLRALEGPVGIGHVRPGEDRFAAVVDDELHRLLAAVDVDVGHHDRCALGGELPGRGPTDPVGGSRHDRRLAVEHPHPSLLQLVRPVSVAPWR